MNVNIHISWTACSVGDVGVAQGLGWSDCSGSSGERGAEFSERAVPAGEDLHSTAS